MTDGEEPDAAAHAETPGWGLAASADRVDVPDAEDDEFPDVDEEDDLDEDDLGEDDDLEDAEMDEEAKLRLEKALAEIDARFGRPPADQVSAFADAHQSLQATLNLIDAN